MTIECPSCGSTDKLPTERDFVWECQTCKYVYHVRECPRTWEEINNEIEERTGKHPLKYYCDRCGVEISEEQSQEYSWCQRCLESGGDNDVN